MVIIMEIIVTKENFEKEVLKSDIPVLVDFWASWCGPCMMLAPTMEELAHEYDGEVLVAKVNVDEEPELAGMFQISSIPTIICFKNGKAVDAKMGFRPKSDFISMFR